MGRFFVWDTETYCRYYWQCYGLEASKLVSLAYPPQYGKLSSSEIRENEVRTRRQSPLLRLLQLSFFFVAPACIGAFFLSFYFFKLYYV